MVHRDGQGPSSHLHSREPRAGRRRTGSRRRSVASLVSDGLLGNISLSNSLAYIVRHPLAITITLPTARLFRKTARTLYMPGPGSRFPHGQRCVWDQPLAHFVRGHPHHVRQVAQAAHGRANKSKSPANAAEPAAVYCGVLIPLTLSRTYSGTKFKSEIKKT